ncbi:glycoside hydrolase family 105 protein [Daldinia caldariorum]|uniref:glycoside hydrolase family 105 protein n=1 Tax=Daldinia caldariorum TaxID=326644 RepID=UPI002007EAC9|nr:glycoside hydrolase family 105 protein [Daldinia caldariorum]KAI1472337.1 glycoside hydrolase family 105 protein [Daldinia caldariorum]
MRVSTRSNLAAATLAFAFASITTSAAGEITDAVRSKNSTWMASSIMSRSQGIMTGNGGSSELLQAGFTQRALTALAAQYPSDAFTSDAKAYVLSSASSVSPFVRNATRDALAYPLDRLSNGLALLDLATPTENLTSGPGSFAIAATALRESIDLNRRNAEGGMWYYTYPHWSYLDGMYSLAPFYVRFHVEAETAYPIPEWKQATVDAANDTYHQLDLLWRHTRNASSGLLAHGYDASRTAVWADPDTGASPHVWGRSLGWYAMALVDLLEVLPESAALCEYRDLVLEKLRSLAGAIVKAVDPATGGWWQVLDEPGREGNYIESSGSAMFAYALLKGTRLGYFATDATLASAAVDAAIRGHGYLTDTFVVRETNGTLGYNGTVSVCSLNSTATYEYYIGQPINYNSVLGSAAYILASLEVERLAAQ